MKILIILCSILLIASTSEAQFKFTANNSSNQYKAKIFVDKCEGNSCSGKATVILYDQISDKEIFTFHSADLDFGLTENQNAKLGWLDLGKYQTPLIFGDFNFDGFEDIAVRNGNNGAYSSPSYDIYLSKDSKFTLNTELTKLASSNLGMFDIDKKAKQLAIHQKDGCCFDKTINYKFDAKNSLYEDSSVIEDSSIADNVTVITQKLVDGKIKRTVQKFKMKDYYNQ
ncbi:XAC2610-related protein [Pedobacter sp. GSP4]|uniref:XAC2610-related protein n=1 Tax=Pedobacter sp. GSP4 TaxID=3453716 RepID=UPI003EE9DEC5